MNVLQRIAVLGVVSATALLAGCGEKPQTAAGIKSDAPPYKGTGVQSFTDRGWEAGDKTAWAQHLKSRLQYGQNEYSRPSSTTQ